MARYASLCISLLLSFTQRRTILSIAQTVGRINTSGILKAEMQSETDEGNYYEVLVASGLYHGQTPLTYHARETLPVGALVLVPMQKRAVAGVVVSKVRDTPTFKTRDILEAYPLPPLPRQLIRLAEWLRGFYPAPLGATLNQILPGAIPLKTINDTPGLSTAAAPTLDTLPLLSTDQQKTLTAITKPDTYILHGDTGTGKTRIYIELAARCIGNGSSAIILTPEIGLTSQLAANFGSIFGDRVVVIHSAMTPKARQQAWLKISKSTTPLIVIGPRSALFSPLDHIGLIVIDEAHEPAYKQEQAPHYHASRVAARLAQEHNAILILGSATPSVSDYYFATEKHKPILRMTVSAKTHQAAKVAPGRSQNPVSTTVVDLTDRSNFGRSQYLSTALLKSIGTSLSRGEQSLLYLNRRGTARVILCNSCGWQATCPHCDLPLTYHHDSHRLQCHTCGYTQTTPTSCPDCHNTDIVFKVAGTKAIEAEVARLYPNARMMRFDTDNKKADRFEQHYDAILRGDIDILIGTQLLAKGLDLPLLSTLGVVIADTSLTFPDYTSEERTFQLLSQVIGRVGRGHVGRSGEPIAQRVVVQTYAPDRPIIKAALARDYRAFYSQEIEERRSFHFPPFYHTLKLSCRRASSNSAERACEQFLYSLEKRPLPLLIEGPMPSFHARIEGKYEWQIVIKSRQRTALLRVIELLKTDAKSGWTYDIDPTNLL